jgi:hypothetical protein
MADHIKTRDDVLGYIEATLEKYDTELLLEVIGDIARSEAAIWRRNAGKSFALNAATSAATHEFS